jgi:hypothetical protein
MTTFRSRPTLLVPLAASALLASGAGIGWAAGGADPAPATVAREPLAQADHPRGADDKTLGLSRVTIMPGSVLASHHHPGTQIAYIAGGTLTYSVETGSVKVMTGPSDDPTRRWSGGSGPARPGRSAAAGGSSSSRTRITTRPTAGAARS